MRPFSWRRRAARRRHVHRDAWPGHRLPHSRPTGSLHARRAGAQDRPARTSRGRTSASVAPNLRVVPARPRIWLSWQPAQRACGRARRDCHNRRDLLVRPGQPLECLLLGRSSSDGGAVSPELRRSSSIATRMARCGTRHDLVVEAIGPPVRRQPVVGLGRGRRAPDVVRVAVDPAGSKVTITAGRSRRMTSTIRPTTSSASARASDPSGAPQPSMPSRGSRGRSARRSPSRCTRSAAPRAGSPDRANDPRPSRRPSALVAVVTHRTRRDCPRPAARHQPPAP